MASRSNWQLRNERILVGWVVMRHYNSVANSIDSQITIATPNSETLQLQKTRPQKGKHK